MKKILALLLIFSVCSQASTPEKMSDREHDGFVGPVRKVFVEWSPIYQSHENVQAGTRCRQMTNLYDRSGRLTQHSVYPGSCGEDEIQESYTYAEDGSRLTKTLEIRGKNSPPPPPAAAIGSRTERETGRPSEVFRYDSSGRLIEAAVVRPSGKIAYKLGYLYDKEGRLIETANYEENGEVSARRVYKYEGNKRVPSEFAYIGRTGKVYERIVYTDYVFNSHGDWVKRKQTSEETLDRKSIAFMLRNIEYY
jgi:hypothetical protein